MCKDCKGITLLKGTDGRSITSIVNNGNGTFSIFLSDGTVFTSPNYTGPAGPTGPTGATGPRGGFGGYSGNWVFSNNTSGAAPGSTFLKFNSAILSSVTSISVSKNNLSGTDLSAFLATFTALSFIRIFKESDSNTFIYARIDAITSTATEYVFSITYISGNGTFSNLDSVVLTYTPTGKVYKEYTAYLSAIGTADPTVTVMRNEIGPIYWTRSSAGTYVGTLTGAFTVNKTFINAGNNFMNTILWVTTGSVDTVGVTVKATGGTYADSLGAFVEVRVYS